MIFQMEKVMPSFEYEPLIFSPELETSNEKEDKGNIDGAGPFHIKTTQEELGHLRGGKDSLKRKVGGKTYMSEQILKQIVLQEVSSKKHAFATT